MSGRLADPEFTEAALGPNDAAAPAACDAQRAEPLRVGAHLKSCVLHLAHRTSTLRSGSFLRGAAIIRTPAKGLASLQCARRAGTRLLRQTGCGVTPRKYTAAMLGR